MGVIAAGKPVYKAIERGYKLITDNLSSWWFQPI